MSTLVDTAVWSLVLRRRPTALNPDEEGLVREFDDLLEAGRILIIGPIRQEVLSGIRDEHTFWRLRRRLRDFSDVSLMTSDYEEAARFGNVCRALGIAGTAVDLLICAVSVRLDVPVFTTDRDFERYAAHLPLRLHRPGADLS